MLSTAWKRFNTSLSFEEFSRSYKLYTELRSYTLNSDLFEELLAEIDPDISKTIKVFWALSEQLDLNDEQKSYFTIAQKFTNQDSELRDKTYIFWGFQYLSGTQVDLIHAMGIRNNVFLPFPKAVWDQTNEFDWIRWVEASDDIELEKPDINKGNFLQVTYPKNYLANTLKGFFQKNIDVSFSVNLVTKYPDLQEVLEIPSSEHFFKIQFDLLEEFISKFSEQVKDYIGEGSLVFLEKIEEELEKTIEKQDFHYVKVIALYRDLVQKWIEQSDSNDLFTSFDAKLLKMLVTLDAPRVSYIPEVSEENILSIGSAFETPVSVKNYQSIYIVSSKYQAIGSANDSFSFDMQSKLASIGPVKRSDLEIYFLIQEISEQLRGNDVYLFSELGLEERDLTLRLILDNFKSQQTEIQPLIDSSSKAKFQSKIIDTANKYSATKLQVYKDCPRKFYYQYLEKVNLFVELETKLLPNEKGTLEHLVIELFMKDYGLFNEESLVKVVRQVLKEYVEKHNKKLSDSDFRTYYQEIYNYSSNGIKLLNEIGSAFTNTKFTFEKEIKDLEGNKEFRGSIDCLIESDQGTIIIDFKRSSASIPLKSELLDYKKIQLYFYGLHGMYDKNLISFGYLNLEEPEKSIFLSSKNELSFFKGIKSLKVYYSQDIDSGLNQYKEIEEKILSNLMLDKKFQPKPDPKVCLYCPLSLTCDKEEPGSDLLIMNRQKLLHMMAVLFFRQELDLVRPSYLLSIWFIG